MCDGCGVCVCVMDVGWVGGRCEVGVWVMCVWCVCDG